MLKNLIGLGRFKRRHDRSDSSFLSSDASIHLGEIESDTFNDDDLYDELDEGDLDIKIEGESDAEEISLSSAVYVGPSKSKTEDKRNWAEHSVDTDPSVHSQTKSYRLDPQVRWSS